MEGALLHARPAGLFYAAFASAERKSRRVLSCSSFVLEVHVCELLFDENMKFVTFVTMIHSPNETRNVNHRHTSQL